MNDIIMHINYGELTFNSFGKNSIEDIVKMAVTIGYDGIEFRGQPPKELSNLSYEEYVDEIARCKKKYGLKTVIMAAPLGEAIHKPKEEQSKEIDNVIKRVEYANKVCNVSVFNTFAKMIQSNISTAPKSSYEFHGSTAATEKDWENTVNVFKKIGKELETLGVKFAFETHMNFIHDIPENTKKLVDMIDCDSIGINMDFGNTVYFPNHLELEETIDLYGDKLFYTHFKNSILVPGVNKRIPTSLSDGEINHRSYLIKLKESGFVGPIGIEAPRSGDKEWFAMKDFNYIKNVITCIE